MKVVIHRAVTGEVLYESDYSEGHRLRVWELRQHMCQETCSNTYFAWQLFSAHTLLQDHKYVADLRRDTSFELSLQAVKRHLRPPTLEASEDILYLFVSIRHRRKLWKLLTRGIQIHPSMAGKRDKICTIVRAIEANYVELVDDYIYPDTVQALLWAQCDPNYSGADQRLPLSQAIRSGDDRAFEQLLQARADPTLQESDQNAPLLLAIQVGAPNYVRLLLQYKADPEITESAPKGTASSPMGSMVQRQTASDLASPFPDILEILQDACIVHHMP